MCEAQLPQLSQSTKQPSHPLTGICLTTKDYTGMDNFLGQSADVPTMTSTPVPSTAVEGRCCPGSMAAALCLETSSKKITLTT